MGIFKAGIFSGGSSGGGSAIEGQRAIFGYQDFVAGAITGTSVTITANENGTSAPFTSSKVISGSAFVVKQSDQEEYIYTGATKFFSSKVTVNSNTTAAITLSGIPHSSWGSVRIWYSILAVSFPDNYNVPSKILSARALDTLDPIILTQDELVNTLISTDATKALTAAQGKILKDDLDGFPDEAKNLTTAEVQQVGNIGTETISATQWGYLGSSNQSLLTTSSPTFNNISITGLVDSRDVAVDGVKLDGVEALADVTDATNIAAAGAIMDGDFTWNGFMIRTAEGSYLNRSLAGTTNQITITNSAGESGSPTFSTPQDINTSSNVNFNKVTVSNNIRTDEVKARDGGGLSLVDDAGNGLFIEDGGQVGIGTSSPETQLSITPTAFGVEKIALYEVGGTYYGLGIRGSMVTYTSAANHVFYSGGKDGSGTEVLRISTSGQVGIGIVPTHKLHVSGNVKFTGSVTKGSGSFCIAHPDPKKNKTHELRHYFVETNSAGGNIYKYQLECEKGVNKFDLPSYFKFLNIDSLVWVNPFNHFGVGYGKVIRNNKIKIVAQRKGIYNILIFGDRKDELAVREFEKYKIEYKL